MCLRSDHDQSLPLHVVPNARHLPRLLRRQVPQGARHGDHVSQRCDVVLDAHIGTLTDLYSVEHPLDGGSGDTADFAGVLNWGVWSDNLLL